MLIWHAIVKNESKIINRCLTSLIPHVDGAVVADTGSTDGTPDLIKQAFAAAGKPCEIHQITFENFAQARNEALQLARDSKLPWEYALLSDCDMELVVTKTPWLNGAKGLSYDMRQTAGGSLTYWNRRLLSRAATNEYRGVTHEYLDVGTAGRIEHAYFLDHTDGSNRAGKLERDIALLEKALEVELNPGLVQRYHFYLGQSYFDLGDWKQAAKHYQLRANLGGWDEERWNAQLHYAHCLRNLGDHPGFVWAMLEAYEIRPQRAETLYDLAKFFRELGYANFRSLLFSNPGMELERPNDMLFVNEYAYKTGLREEFAICAYYDPEERGRGAEICDALTLDRSIPSASREQARYNQFWYLKSLQSYVPSFKSTQIKFTPPDGWAAMNPSLINHNGRVLVLVRTVNYEITKDGRYVIRGAPSAPVIIDTRNFLVRVDDTGAVTHKSEIKLPKDLPNKFELVQGFEDSRLFEWQGQLWTLSTVRQLTEEGWCEQVLAPIVNTIDGGTAYGEWLLAVPLGAKQQEKNWMPWVDRNDLRFVYRLGTLVGMDGTMIAKHEHRLAIDHISGGSQVIEVGLKLYLAIVHEARQIPGRPNRYYQHRFVLLLRDGTVLSISPPFFLHDRQIEFAAGLARFGSELVVSYGLRDEEAWLARMSLDEVLGFCG